MTSDPFTETFRCAERLVEEYRQHPKLIVAFDFDDTVFDYHKRGSKYDRVLRLLKRCQKEGFYLLLLTASESERFLEIVDYLGRWLGLMVHSVNENPIPLPFGNNGKPYYNILLDDRAGLGQACDVLDLLFDKIDS